MDDNGEASDAVENVLILTSQKQMEKTWRQPKQRRGFSKYSDDLADSIQE
jgi:hypothetical protein